MSGSRRSVVRLGTRGSALALTQTEWVAQRLRTTGMEVRTVPVRTVGDTRSDPVAEIGVGVFVSALREALVAGEVDAAVHSYKDLPTAADPRLVLAAVPERADPRDALVARHGMVLDELPPGAVLGTGSPRRAAQLDGVVVAAAGLARRSHRRAGVAGCPGGQQRPGRRARRYRQEPG
jgi:hydroxymethylbilane synthase